jgi:hypothetical protein
VTWRKRRGLPGQKSATPSASASSSKSKPKRRRRGVLRTLLRLVAIWVVAVFVYAALFVGVKCYGSVKPAPANPPSFAREIRGYPRSEAFTYLTLPEWFIVYSADEYASFIGTRRPSGFPHLGSVRQYWTYYGAACAATKRTYPFETGYHVMLGIIGASFTIESSFKALYENTFGRLTEWLSTTDTAEDAFARNTAREYGAFMHTVPWFEFPFGSKLWTLWRDTPLTGPHLLRKIERRFALSIEYGVKAGYGFVIGKASGATYGAEEQRIHARIDQAPASVFSDPAVKQVTRLGDNDYVVTLPRYEAFTKSALGLLKRGARFVDIAGNDEILVTALARRGISTTIPDVRVIAAQPVLTDPTMQRLAFSVRVAALREVVGHLERERATVEHLYDY